MTKEMCMLMRMVYDDDPDWRNRHQATLNEIWNDRLGTCEVPYASDLVHAMRVVEYLRQQESTARHAWIEYLVRFVPVDFYRTIESSEHRNQSLMYWLFFVSRYPAEMICEAALYGMHMAGDYLMAPDRYKEFCNVCAK